MAGISAYYVSPIRAQGLINLLFYFLSQIFYFLISNQIKISSFYSYSLGKGRYENKKNVLELFKLNSMKSAEIPRLSLSFLQWQSSSLKGTSVGLP